VTGWLWVEEPLALAIHDRQLALNGGPAGLRDRGALVSALARPKNLAAYGDPDAPALAAAYAFGIARNHAFVDGNKRTAWMLARLFLRDNGLIFTFDKGDAIRTMLALAAGEITEDELASWFRERIARGGVTRSESA
jgi:death-on-curing protein